MLRRILPAFLCGWFLSSIVPAALTSAGENYALLVAVGDYDQEHLRPLKFTRPDVLEFQKALVDSGFKPENIVLMHDHSKSLGDYYEKLDGRESRHYLPLKANIVKQLNLLLGRLRSEDSVIVAFAGHGVQFKGLKQSFYCPSDANLDNKESLLAFEEVFSKLKDCDAGRKLFLVDACQNDPLSASSRSRQSVDLESVTRPQTEAVPEGIIALFSCKAGQKSFELPELGHGVFFYHLLDGWKGKGDLNGDGKLSYQELASYTEKSTSEYAAKNLQVLQTPQLRAEFSGEWVLKTVGKAGPQYRPLFNGKDFTGWVLASGDRTGWSIQNGELVATGTMQNRGWLMTDKDYSDYTLRLEYQTEAGGNSGVTVHAGTSDAKVPEIQILDESFPAYANTPNAGRTGAIYMLTDSKRARVRPVGEWNQMEIDVRGSAVNISLNGERVTSTALGLLKNAEIPGLIRNAGRIGLQSWQGGTVRFRKIEIAEHAFTPLFNGRDLSGWTVDSGDRRAWTVSDGTIVADGNSQTRGWLMTNQEYADFALRFEFQPGTAGNGGITFHAARGEGNPTPGSVKSPEIQLEDDTYSEYAEQKAIFRTGALFGLAGDGTAKMASGNSWNAGEIEVRAHELSVTINGTVVTRTKLDELARSNAQIPGLGRASGKIGLQAWVGVIRYRNLRIEPLAPSNAAARP